MPCDALYFMGHAHHLIKFHSMDPASDGVLWVLWRKPSGKTGRKRLLCTKKIEALSWRLGTYNCHNQAERMEREEGEKIYRRVKA